MLILLADREEQRTKGQKNKEKMLVILASATETKEAGKETDRKWKNTKKICFFLLKRLVIRYNVC